MEIRPEGIGHSLDEMVPIQMGYADLYEHLLPECSEVDRVVKYVLDLNILVRYINVKYSHRATLEEEDISVAKKSCPNFRHRRFVPGQIGEDGKILKRLEQLFRDLSIKNPERCIQDFGNSKKVIFVSLLKS